MIFNNKKIYQYKPFEKIDSNLLRKLKKECDIDELCFNENNIVYVYKEKSVLPSNYIMYKNYNEPKNIYMIGDETDYAVIYKNNLFLCNKGGEIHFGNRTIIQRYDLRNKVSESYNLRWKLGKWVSINGFGRFHTTDNYLKMQVENDELVIYVHREKSNAPEVKDDIENCDMDYEVIFRYENKEFVPYYRIDGVYHKLIKE